MIVGFFFEDLKSISPSFISSGMFSFSNLIKVSSGEEIKIFLLIPFFHVPNWKYVGETGEFKLH
jgi:hypothetical protein